MVDRFIDMFVGFYNPNGQLEHRLLAVVKQNISTKIFLEAFISFGLFFFEEEYMTNPMIYGSIKILRYGRLFELDSQIQEIIEINGKESTVFEIKQMEKKFDIFKFVL